MAGEDYYFCGVDRSSRHISMALRVLIHSDRAGEEVRDSLLFSDRQRGVCQRTGSNGGFLGIDRTERIAHQRCSNIFISESSCAANGNFNLAECLKHRCVIIATKERRIDSSGNKPMKLALRADSKT